MPLRIAFGTDSVTSPRLLLDISTLLRHWERADGITRTLAKFAVYALDQIPDVTFVYLGGDAPLRVKTEYVRLLLSEKIRIDVSHFPDLAAKTRVRDRLPFALKSAILWLQRPRRQALLLLERIAFYRPGLAALAQRIKLRLLNEKYRRAMTDADGALVNLVPHDIALCAMSTPREDDVLVLAGSDWALMSNAAERFKPRPKTVAFCHDIIPLLFPETFSDRAVAAFRGCIENAFARANLVFFSSNQIARDTADYWHSQSIPAPPTEIIALGADMPPPTHSVAARPAFLTPRKFALFVSTIEPRKNHRLLFDVWKRLLDEGIPQKFNFKLVFVGRKGWMVDDLWQELTAHPSFGTSLIVLSDVDDAALSVLYDDCAFTLYPSLYEGFGLPIIESFRHAKPVIASTAGALPETVAGFSTCLDPTDEIAWRDMLRLWITDPTAYGEFERDIKLRYVARDWNVTSEEFFRVIRQRFMTKPAMVGDVGLEPTTR